MKETNASKFVKYEWPNQWQCIPIIQCLSIHFTCLTNTWLDGECLSQYISIHFRLMFNYFFTWVRYHPISQEFMMTSSNFTRYWPFLREFTGHRWIPSKMASGAELWCFLWSATEQTVEQIINTSVYETPLHSLWRHRNAFGFISLVLGWAYYSYLRTKSDNIGNSITHVTKPFN